MCTFADSATTTTTATTTTEATTISPTTTELVDMISTQRAYEMNSKVISTVDQMLSTINQNL